MSDLVKRLRTSTEMMANRCAVDMVLWNEHSNATLEAADRLFEMETLLLHVHELLYNLTAIIPGNDTALTAVTETMARIRSLTNKEPAPCA